MPRGKIKLIRGNLVPFARVAEKIKGQDRRVVLNEVKRLAEEGRIELKKIGAYWYVSKNVYKLIGEIKD